MGSGSLSLSQVARDAFLAWLRLCPQKPRPPAQVHPITCSFQRKSRRAVDSTCCAWRYSARAKTSRITGVIYLSATLPTAGLQITRDLAWCLKETLTNLIHCCPRVPTYQSSPSKVSLEEALAGRYKSYWTLAAGRKTGTTSLSPVTNQVYG